MRLATRTRNATRFWEKTKWFGHFYTLLPDHCELGKWLKCRTEEQSYDVNSNREGNRNVILWAMHWIPHAWEVKPSDVASSMITINPRQFFCDVKKELTFLQQCRERRTNMNPSNVSSNEFLILWWIAKPYLKIKTRKRNEMFWFFFFDFSLEGVEYIYQWFEPFVCWHKYCIKLPVHFIVTGRG